MLEITSKTNVYDELVRLSRERKISISELCRRAGVNRHSLPKWKVKNPATLLQVQKLVEQLEKINVVNNETD